MEYPCVQGELQPQQVDKTVYSGKNGVRRQSWSVEKAQTIEPHGFDRMAGPVTIRISGFCWVA